MTSEHGDEASRHGEFSRPGQSPYGPPSGGPHTPPYYGGPQYPQPQRKPHKLVIVLIILIGVIALLLIGVVAALVVTSSSGRAESVYAECTEQVPDSGSATLTSDEKSIRYSSGEYPDSSDFQMIECLMDLTGAPGSVEARMDSTRALDGTQDAEWEDWSAFWTYHPDNGFDVTFTAN